MKLLFLIFCITFLSFDLMAMGPRNLLVSTKVTEDKANTEIWMHPNKLFTDRSMNLENFIFSNENLKDWRKSFDMMTAFQIHLQSLQSYPSDKFSRLQIETLKKANKETYLTTGGLSQASCNEAKNNCIDNGGNGNYDDPSCKPYFDQIGKSSAQLTIQNIEQYFRIDGVLKLDGLSLDGGMKRAMACQPNQSGSHCNNNCKFPVMKAVEQMAIYFQTIKGVYPEIQLDYVFNFINWRYSIDPAGRNIVESLRGPGRSHGQDTDLRPVIAKLVSEMEKRGVRLDSISNEGGALFYSNQNFDPNYPAGEFIPWWPRLVALRKQTDRLGIKTHQAINVTTGMNDCNQFVGTRAYTRCATNRDATALDATIEFLNSYRTHMTRAGLSENAEIMDTMQWKEIPENPLSEDTPNSFMNMFYNQMTKVLNH